MIILQNVLEVINEIIVLPVAVITFFLLVYIVAYLWQKDPDVIRSKIFYRDRVQEVGTIEDAARYACPSP
ncbi:MAG: hypothetical protein ABOK23_00710 [Candidatus Methanoperedens sp.]|nr:hypothetical protein [Candidatus Methanoperedens sp.]